MITIRDATRDDLINLLSMDVSGVNPIRQMDKDEGFAFSGRHIYDVLRDRAFLGPCRVALDEQDIPLALWGFHAMEVLDDCSIVWLVGTDLGQLRAKEIHRHHRAELRAMRQQLVAYSIHEGLDRWHEALGFRVTERFTGGAFNITKYVRNP